MSVRALLSFQSESDRPGAEDPPRLRAGTRLEWAPTHAARGSTGKGTVTALIIHCPQGGASHGKYKLDMPSFCFVNKRTAFPFSSVLDKRQPSLLVRGSDLSRDPGAIVLVLTSTQSREPLPSGVRPV